PRERAHARGHDPLAARLLAGKTALLEDRDAEAAAAEEHGERRARDPAARDEHVGVHRLIKRRGEKSRGLWAIWARQMGAAERTASSEAMRRRSTKTCAAPPASAVIHAVCTSGSAASSTSTAR